MTALLEASFVSPSGTALYPVYCFPPNCPVKRLPAAGEILYFNVGKDYSRDIEAATN